MSYYKWCPKGCGKTAYYLNGKTDNFKNGCWECSKCFCRFSRGEMQRLGYVKGKKSSNYISKRRYDIRKLVKEI